MTTHRYNTNRAIINDCLDRAIDNNGDMPSEYAAIEDREYRIYHLAEAGDALESYLQYIRGNCKESDPEITGILTLIDTKIEAIRKGSENMRRTASMSSDKFNSSFPEIMERLQVQMPEEGVKI